MEEQEIYAALGKVVVMAAHMEWEVASLVAAVEGKDRDRTEELYTKSGKVMEALKRAGRSDDDLQRLYEEAVALIGRRHLIAHSLSMISMDARSHKLYLYWHPKTGAENAFYLGELLAIVRDIEVMCDRLHQLTQERRGIPKMFVPSDQIPAGDQLD